jgi:predicted extracellular nuclease
MSLPFRNDKDANNLYTIAFYNLENLFNTSDDKHTLDRDFTPNGKKKWTERRYRKKLNNLSNTISRIGKETALKPPVLVGIVEIENAEVVKDLLATKNLNDYQYDYIHFESPDERGIDTALLYIKSHFEIIETRPIPLLLYDEDGNRDTTRDILYVYGKLNEEKVHVFVNHWPSRRSGSEETSSKRILAAETILNEMDKIEKDYVDPKYVVMGDFNDNPTAKSIQLILSSKPIYNPMESLLSDKRGSANYKRKWSLFDQIMISKSFFNYSLETHSYSNANIYDSHSLKEWKGKYAGNPFRTYVGTKYLGGSSDHFPVYIQLEYNP